MAPKSVAGSAAKRKPVPDVMANPAAPEKKAKVGKKAFLFASSLLDI
jgi:hypothetical protein